MTSSASKPLPHTHGGDSSRPHATVYGNALGKAEDTEDGGLYSPMASSLWEIAHLALCGSS